MYIFISTGGETMNNLENIKCFLLDMDGTFYLGEKLIDGALGFLEILKAQGKSFLFLTNNSSKESWSAVLRHGMPYISKTQIEEI
jgi:ribonucleotide monophosphatase NagD (HAD superfamily)